MTENEKSDKERHAQSFEEALSRLEEIVNGLERGQLSLEESMAFFEEGMALSRICGEKLQEAQGKIEKLVKRPDGSLAWTDVPPPPDTQENRP